MDESVRVLAPGEAKGLFAFLQDSVGSTVVDVMRGEHRDPGMSMLGVVTQGKNERQKAVVAAMASSRRGKPGWYFRVLNCASEKGLSSLTWGRLSERVTPRSASSCAVHLLVIGALSECSVSVWGSMPCLRHTLAPELEPFQEP